MFFIKAQILLLCGLLLAIGVASQSCNQCQDYSYSDSALCKCDEKCLEFGDCCDGVLHSNSSLASVNSSLNKRVQLHCHSILPSGIQVVTENEAFLMISSCPDSWLDSENSSIHSNCSTPTEKLPPVTDISTGLVYLNEFCAHCNGVTELETWSTQLSCSSDVYLYIITSTLDTAMLHDPDILSRECINCSFMSPNITGIPPPRSCIPRVDSCLSLKELEKETSTIIEIEDYDNLVKLCQSGPLDLHQGNISRVVYRNSACAVCNGETDLKCFLLQLPPPLCCEYQGGADSFQSEIFDETIDGEHNTPARGDPLSRYKRSPSFNFLVTLSSLRKHRQVITVDPSECAFCDIGEVYNGTDCIPVSCPPQFIETEEGCSYVNFSSILPAGSVEGINSTISNCSRPIVLVNNKTYTDLENNTILLIITGIQIKVLEYDNLDRPIICQHSTTLNFSCSFGFVTLNESEYMSLENGSILVNNRLVEVSFRDMDGRPLICPDILNSAKNIILIGLLASLPGVQELTYVGCSLSVLGAIAVILTYSIFKQLQTFPGLVLINLCIAIFSTNILFIVGGAVLEYHFITQICSTLAILLHFFYLVQFSWMSIFSFEMSRNFYQARKLVEDSKQTKCKYFLVYLAIGWALPLAISVATIIINFTTDKLVLYGVGEGGCWINQYKAFIIVFILPLSLSLSVNLILFIFTTVFLCRAYRDQSKVNRGNLIAMIRVWLAIFVITGLTWIFGFLAILHNFSWMWYLFVIFNSTQGFGVLVTFIFTKKVLILYMDLFKKKIKSGVSNSNDTRTSVLSSRTNRHFQLETKS